MIKASLKPLELNAAPGRTGIAIMRRLVPSLIESTVRQLLGYRVCDPTTVEQLIRSREPIPAAVTDVSQMDGWGAAV
jgi:hypothetical protein